MKNIFKILIMVMALTSCTSGILLSSDRTFIEEKIRKNYVETKIKGRYDYNKDIVATSIALHSEASANSNVEERLHSAITEYAYKELLLKFNDAKLSGPGFDKYQMRRFAVEISDRNIKEAKEIAKFIDQSGKYYIVKKISKKDIKKQVNIIFELRLRQVIKSLDKLKDKTGK